VSRKRIGAEDALDRLKALGTEKGRLGMARYGIATERAFGVSMPNIRSVAREMVRDHAVAEALWQSEVHEARILAGFVDRPEWVTSEQMDRWTAQFDSWDVCDQICGNLWDRTPFRDEKIFRWSGDEHEFVRRAAFATIAWHAVHGKSAQTSDFLAYFPLVRDARADNRNFVRKAVSWALRQIGKRSAELHPFALALANELANSPEKAARWIGKDVIRELDTEKMRERLGIGQGG
jgi:3-methyladenine DNA glycosylase AlkD